MMKMRVNFLLSAVLILHCASAASQDKWAGLAKTIDAKCTNECAGYMEQAKAGVMRAHHEAAACKTGCYYNNLPDDYPNKAAIKKMSEHSWQEAKRYGSKTPQFVIVDSPAPPAPKPGIRTDATPATKPQQGANSGGTARALE